MKVKLNQSDSKESSLVDSGQKESSWWINQSKLKVKQNLLRSKEKSSRDRQRTTQVTLDQKWIKLI